MDELRLAVAVIWALFTCLGVLMLLPFMDRRLRALDMKIKRSKSPLKSPNLPQRLVYLLLASLMTTVAFATAFHHDLSETIGISSGTAWRLMMLLSLLYFALGWLKKPRTDGEQPKT